MGTRLDKNAVSAVVDVMNGTANGLASGQLAHKAMIIGVRLKLKISII